MTPAFRRWRAVAIDRAHVCAMLWFASWGAGLIPSDNALVDMVAVCVMASAITLVIAICDGAL